MFRFIRKKIVNTEGICDMKKFFSLKIFYIRECALNAEIFQKQNNGKVKE